MNQSTSVQELINQLLALGYHKHQINQIIGEALNTEKIAQLSEDQEQILIQDLQEYVNFAMKCSKKTK